MIDGAAEKRLDTSSRFPRKPMVLREIRASRQVGSYTLEVMATDSSVKNRN
jgi:hypothetical protein